ncbi:MAG: bifunctional YncE family protein/alkaline phosphatase family protein [Nitrososphaerota archaeon]|nr:bifunctional YncE family protein/alkaline phosphatase family protein [Nitrososphaerota archaeon]
MSLVHAGGSGLGIIPHPVRIRARNRARFVGILPTGRRVTPVGRIVSTPNFPTGVAVSGGRVAVLANGSTPWQTITWYTSDLDRVSRLAAFSEVAPPHRIVLTTPGGSGLAINPRYTGPAGVVYTTDQPASVRRQEALETLRAEENPQPIPTRTLSHSDLFQGLVAGPDGVWYATGGASDEVLALRLHGRRVVVLRRYPLTWQPFPKSQYPYTYQGDHDRKPWLFYPASVVVGPHDRHLYVTGLLANSLARIDLATGRTRYVNVGSYPFAVVLADRGRRLVVSDWGGDAVTVVNRAGFRVLGRIPTGPGLRLWSTEAGVHPTALVAVPRSPDVWVADANDDTLVELDVRTLRPVRRIDDAPYRDAPPGSYPDALAYDRDRLYVANAGNDDVAVYDARDGKRLGLIPTAWYPTALAIHEGVLYVTAGKGFGTGPNRAWQYIGNMMHGLLQEVPLADLSHKLPRWTERALWDDGFTRAQRERRARENERIARFLRRRIRYVVFILRENKTFDEDLGDYRAAGLWADPRFDLYGAKELPNLYRVWAPHNVLFADFMTDGEVTAQGHQWVDGASDSDVVQRLWPEYYSNRGLLWNAGPGGTASLDPRAPGGHDPYQYATRTLGHFTNPWISYPERLYLFNDLLEHHASFEDFGEDLSRRRDGILPATLRAHVDRTYPGWDRMLLDKTRVEAAIRWLKVHPGKAFPRFIYIWIPDDHTAGWTPCYYSPDYYVAENDHATAAFLHYLSTTPEWKRMVVFLTEDDAQSGADHINAHRTFALALGPWVKAGDLDTTPYSQVNIVKTIEAILGLPPMSQWDANAAVFSGIWRRRPRPDPVPVLPLEVPVQFNRGQCPRQRLLRREAGLTGHVLTPAWLKAHTDPHGPRHGTASPLESMTPTGLLEIPGPEQLKEEWVAAKGPKGYKRFAAYLRRYARVHGTTVASYEANDGGLH